MNTLNNKIVYRDITVPLVTINPHEFSHYEVPGVSGYIPISAVYLCDEAETVIYPTPPRCKVENAGYGIALYNTYNISIKTRGTIKIMYIS